MQVPSVCTFKVKATTARSVWSHILRLDTGVYTDYDGVSRSAENLALDHTSRWLNEGSNSAKIVVWRDQA